MSSRTGQSVLAGAVCGKVHLYIVIPADTRMPADSRKTNNITYSFYKNKVTLFLPKLETELNMYLSRGEKMRETREGKKKSCLPEPSGKTNPQALEDI